MIHVALADEPDDFDAKVRQPGLSAIGELVGEQPTLRRPGPRRAQVASRREEIPASKFPDFWTRAVNDLMTAYHRICAYVACYIEPVTGMPTVDHMIPKSQGWDQVYEWSNFRLACSRMNSRKNDAPDVLDPFEVETGWFELEVVSFQLKPSAGVDAPTRRRITDTITRLGLNDQECRDLREEYVTSYWGGAIPLNSLTRRAPFIAMELRRQGRLREADK